MTSFPATYKKNYGMETSHPTASAAFYKLFALASSVPSTYLNPLILSLNDFSDITLFMQHQNQKSNYLLEKGSAFLKIISRAYLAKLGIDSKNKRKPPSDSL